MWFPTRRKKTTVADDCIYEDYILPYKKKKYTVVLTESEKANSKDLVSFSLECMKLCAKGVSVYDVVREWNECQTNFYNRVYVIEEEIKEETK